MVIDDRYSLEEQIGVGGMATVWRATDTLLGRQVAIKRLSPHLKSNKTASERFRREGQAAARLSHPGILTVFDAGEDEDGPWIAMELIRGETLAKRLSADGPMDVATVASFIEQAAAAIDYAHENGIVHRDIKPANLMIEPGGRIRLADFGIAKPLDDPATVTSPGEMVGTISYVAPEIIRGEKASAASDIYSLAAVAYEMLTGEKPFKGDTTAGLLEAIRLADGPALDGKVPAEVAPALARAMAQDPGQRPNSARAFAAEMDHPATLVLPLDSVRPATLPTGPLIARGSDEPTIPTTPIVGARDRAVPNQNPAPERASSRRGVSGLMLAAAGVLALLVVIAALALAGADPDPGAQDVSSTTAPAASTTTTTVAETTTIPATPDSLAAEISAVLGGLQPPEYKPKDMKEIEDQVFKAIDQWEDDKPDDAAKTLADAVKKVEELPQSAARETLLDLLDELGGLMGLTDAGE